jgi:hypothetical protein
MANGGSGFDFGGIFDPLLGVLAAVIDAIIAFLNALVNVLVQILNFLYQGELGIFGFTQAGDSSIWRIFKTMVDNLFKLHVIKALKDLRDLYEKLARWVAKLKKWLDKLQKIQAQLQNKALKDFINLVQRIRKILLIFRLFHLKFAKKLDDWLAGIEGKLIRRVVDNQRKTNEIIAWLNLILDPIHGLSHIPLFLALEKSVDAALVVFTGHGINYWFSKRPTTPLVIPQSITVKTHYTALADDLRTGGGDVAAWRGTFAQMQDLIKEIR